MPRRSASRSSSSSQSNSKPRSGSKSRSGSKFKSTPTARSGSRSSGKRKTSTSASSSSRRKAKGAGKVGSAARAAKRFGGKSDFGVSESRANTEYARRKGREAKFTPTGSHPIDPRQEIGATQQARVSGVGKSNAGPGGASSGDLDPDIIGVGGAGGLAQAPADPSRVADPEWSDGSSDEFASGPHARGENQGASGGAGGDKRVSGSTVDRSGGDESTTEGYSLGRDNPGASAADENSGAAPSRRRGRAR